jgi:hypothetical protein
MRFPPVELSVDPNVNNSLGMLNSSTKWLNAAAHLIETSNDKLYPGMEFSSPVYFMILHGLEVTLKSFLCARGISETRLRNLKEFGHDLRKLINEAEKKDLHKICPIGPAAQQRIRLIAEDYAGKHLQYFMGNSLHQWPLAHELLQDVRDIRDAIENEFRAHLRAAHK